MNKLYSSRTFQFFAIIIMGGLCLLLDTLTQINFDRIELPKNRPEYNGAGVHGRVFSKTGKLLYLITSKSAWQYPDNDKIYLQDLHLFMYSESSDVVKYELLSEDGWVDHNKKIGYLGESAHFILHESNNEPEINIYSSAVDLDLNKNLLKSKNDVRATQGKSVITGHGFSYERDREFLTINSRVKVVYYDEKNNYAEK